MAPTISLWSKMGMKIKSLGLICQKQNFSGSLIKLKVWRLEPVINIDRWQPNIHMPATNTQPSMTQEQVWFTLQPVSDMNFWQDLQKALIDTTTETQGSCMLAANKRDTTKTFTWLLMASNSKSELMTTGTNSIQTILGAKTSAFLDSSMTITLTTGFWEMCSWEVIIQSMTTKTTTMRELGLHLIGFLTKRKL